MVLSLPPTQNPTFWQRKKTIIVELYWDWNHQDDTKSQPIAEVQLMSNLSNTHTLLFTGVIIIELFWITNIGIIITLFIDFSIFQLPTCRPNYLILLDINTDSQFCDQHQNWDWLQKTRGLCTCYHRLANPKNMSFLAQFKFSSII